MKRVSFLLLMSLLFLSSCQPKPSLSSSLSSSFPSSEASTEISKSNAAPEWKYEGEDYVMRKPSKVYGKENFEEGKETTKSTYKTILKWFTNHGNHLYGELSLPLDYNGKDKLPTVLLCHGFNSNATEWDRFLPYFCSSGYAAFAFDFRAATEFRQYCDGSFVEMSLDSEKSDIKAAMAFLKSLDCVDPDNVFLFGHSQGGLLVSLAAADDDLKNEFNALVSLSPAYSLIDDIQAKFSMDNLPSTAEILYATVGKSYLYSALKYSDYPEVIAHYPGDVLMCHGAKDNVIPESTNQKAREAYGEKLIYYTAPDAYHDFMESDLDLMMPEVVFPFLNAHKKAS